MSHLQREQSSFSLARSSSLAQGMRGRKAEWLLDVEGLSLESARLAPEDRPYVVSVRRSRFSPNNHGNYPWPDVSPHLLC